MFAMPAADPTASGRPVVDGDRADHAEATAEERVHRELLAVRKRADGLSSTSITSCRVLVDLLGEGDPLIAMTRLTHRILETIELDDDAVRITAAAYSLGLGSAGRTHLHRLTDFGIEYGYEARQARRLSDEGLRELARLITTNWVVHAVPSVEVFVVQISDRSFAVQVNTRRQWYIDMQALVIEAQDGDGRRRPLEPLPVVVTRESSDDGRPRDTSTTLKKFIRLPALAPGDEHCLRVN